MRIGILTFHNAVNYGAVLQSFALKQYLEKKGMQVSLIDFCCNGNDFSLSPQNIQNTLIKNNSFLKKMVKLSLFKCFALNDYLKKYDSFLSFKNEFLTTEDCNSNYDLIICGSDQIWNPRITNGLRKEYFGIINDKKNIALSYAASCGDLNELSDIDKKDLLKYSSNLKLIGVREKSLYNFFVKNKLDCYLNIDPTFLLSKNDYINFLKLRKIDDSYLLVYNLQNDKKIINYAKKISKIKNLKIKVICGYISYNHNSKNFFFDKSPIEFLEYVYNAKHIITNSFHGLAFSLIFEKQFNVVLPSKRTSRLLDLLDELRLNSRIINGNDNINIEDLDYNYINKILNDKIMKSVNFLEKGLD